jgi:alcohol dehydrogenase class IV
MAIGSHLAGRAIDISKTTAPHALSYAITKRYGVSHGHAVALTLGAFIEAHCAAEPDRLRAGVDPRGHRRVMAEILDRLGAADGTQARGRLSALMERVGLAPRLSEAGVGAAEDRRRLVRAVNAERLANNPVRFGEADLDVIVGQAA